MPSSEAMGTPEFGDSSGKLLETLLAAQKSVRDNMRTYLETMNVPTREDIARLGEIVVGLEEKIDQVADRLDAIEDAIRAVPRRAGWPRRTHRGHRACRNERGCRTCRTQRGHRAGASGAAATEARPEGRPGAAGRRQAGYDRQAFDGRQASTRAKARDVSDPASDLAGRSERLVVD